MAVIIARVFVHVPERPMRGAWHDRVVVLLQAPLGWPLRLTLAGGVRSMIIPAFGRMPQDWRLWAVVALRKCM